MRYKNTEKIGERIVSSILDYSAKYGRMPWENGLLLGAGLQAVGSSGKPYNGVNQFLCSMYIMLRDFDSCMFVTSGYLHNHGAYVKPGEKAFEIIFYKILWKDEYGQLVPDKVAELYPDKEKTRKGWTSVPLLKTNKVFNLAQTTLEYEPIPKENGSALEKVQKAEEILSMYKDCPPILNETSGGNCAYSPTLDVVKCPGIGAFKSEAYYYGTLFHELVHSTGHEKRLKRPISGMFGSESYAKEELVAELGSAMLMAMSEFRDEQYIPNHTAYLQSWASVIKKGDFLKKLSSAYRGASSAVSYITGGIFD